METILQALKEKYHPVGIVVYGSFANGTNGLNSDFDAMLLTEDGEEQHDHSRIAGTELDVFIYPLSRFDRPYAPEEFVQIWDGTLILDKTGLLEALQKEVRAYISHAAEKSREENEHNVVWCRKMLQRTKRGDMEGLYRMHWLLRDSLEIYFDLRGWYFFGPKKAIRRMQEEDPRVAEAYDRALRSPEGEALFEWVRMLERLFVQRYAQMPEDAEKA